MLRPTFHSFETAKKALTNSQLGLDTVGHNIANVNTGGFTRQRVDQVSISLSASKSKYTGYGYNYPGLGSETVGINQIRDPFLDKRYRTEAASTGEYGAVANGLGEINKVFDEIMTTGSHAKMSEFITALDRLIATADSKELATVLRNKGEQVAQILNRNSDSLDNVETQLQEELGFATTDVNSILERIAMLNVKIRDDNFYGNPANELNDERNMLIDQLSEYLPITVKTTPVEVGGIVLGELSIEIKGSGDSKNNIDPIVLVQNGTYAGVEVGEPAENGDTTIHLIDGQSGMRMPVYLADGSKSSDITKKLYTGSLKGHLGVLNGRGVFASHGENGFRGIPYYRQALNDFASTFAATMNDLNTLKVYGPNGEVIGHTIGRDLFVSNDGSDTITAANLAVSQEWIQNPLYIETAAKNNALYADKEGYLCIPNPEGGAPTKTEIKYTDVHSIDKDGRLLNAAGKMLDLTGAITEKPEDAVKISQLQRAITVESTVQDPSFKTKYYWGDEDGGGDGYYFNTRKKDAAGEFIYEKITDPAMEGEDKVTGLDKDGYLIGADGERITVAHPAAGDARGRTDRDFKPEHFTTQDTNGNDVFFYHDTNGVKHEIPSIGVVDIDKSGYLLGTDGKRVEFEVNDGSGAGTTKKVTISVAQLQQFKTELKPSDLNRFKHESDKMYSPGDPTPNELLPGASANDNLLDIKHTLAKAETIFGNGFSGTFQEYLVGFQGDMGLDAELNDALLGASIKVLSGLADSRDGISAVSIDEEAINMMTFQNYYNAAARYMTVLDEALGTIIQGMGVVGR